MKGFKLLVIIYTFLVTGCQIRNSSDGIELEMKTPPPSSGEQRFDFAKATLGLKDLQQSAISTCIKCHSQKQDPFLNTVVDWRENQEDVLSEIESGDMPPADEGFKSLSKCEIALIKKWFDLGAPENSDVAFTSVEGCSTGSMVK